MRDIGNLDALLPHATETERQQIEAIRKHGGVRAAAAALGLDHSALSHALMRARRRAAQRDPALHATSAPPGYVLRGASTLLDADGKVRAQWVKTRQDAAQALEMLRDAVAEVAEAGRGKLPPLRAPGRTDADLLAVYPLADLHLGMLAWGEETGADYDLEIAERVLSETVDALVATAPPAEQALLVNLGDYLHVDDDSSRTKAHGNQLDTDSRHAKIARVGIRLLRRVVDRLLQRHARVTVWTLPGNHDGTSSTMLALALEALYEREPRVTVDTDPGMFRRLRWGSSLIAATHGHTMPAARLPGLMAASWPQDWGETSAGGRIWYLGHVHHDSAEEHPGCLVESMRSVARRDSWTAASGYHSGRDLKCDLWHRERGRVARVIQRAVGG